MRFYTTAYLVFFTLPFLSGCISVPVGPVAVQSAQNIEYQNPASPFEKRNFKDLDAYWLNEKNGNSISVFSDCSGKDDPSLHEIEKQLVHRISESHIIKSTRFPYNQRVALKTTAQGEVDGVPSKIQIVVLKKNSCIYILNYVSANDFFTEDLGIFEKFVTGFKAP